MGLPKDEYIEYRIFLKNGVYYSFIIKKDEFNASAFNPKKGNIGFVIGDNKREKFNLMEYSPINCGAFSKDDFKINGDTLIISAGSNKGYRNWYYYIKEEVPKEWISWPADL